MAKTQIQWTGNNLREVIDFVGGLHPKFKEWFKSWEEYEEYVRSHDGIFKLFLADGQSHYMIQPGCYIEKDDEKIYNKCRPITEGKFRLKKIISLV